MGPSPIPVAFPFGEEAAVDDDRNFEFRVRQIVLEVLAEQAASVLGDPDVSPVAKSAAGQQLSKAAARKRKDEK